MITAQKLKQIAPHASAQALEIYPAILNEVLPKYEITGRARVAAFLSQVLHESGSLKYVREIWGPTKQQLRYERDFARPWDDDDPRNQLAFRLGNEFKGDGRKFAGKGLIQVTGRTNTRACSLALFKDNRLEQNPDILATPRYAVESACWFWKKAGLNAIADQPEDWKDEKGRNKLQAITRRVNGGFTGLVERVEFYNRARVVLK